jgi:hypothetical protein
MIPPKYTADELRVWEGFAGQAIIAMWSAPMLWEGTKDFKQETHAEDFVEAAANVADMMMQRRNDRKAR